MPEPVIRVENLGKRYRLGVARHDTFRDRIAHALRAPFRSRAAGENGSGGEFWALQNVSFEVNRGDVLGVVGRNGAGKSTLLKILSRITEPTTGRVSIRGRVASLLEVGTGFHPELSGRDNIFLNGAILGMSRPEIRRKFDEIVAFAEVGRFIDTPVKHYSSGMYVRLAFAVAAHLESEILLVDEVLAVGDAAFQQKCLQKISAIRTSGRTVLFVSHNLSTLRQLCDLGLLLDHGSVRFAGGAAETLDRYLSAGTGATGLWQRPDRAIADKPLYFERAALQNDTGEVTAELHSGQTFSLALDVRARERLDNAQIAVRVTNQEGIAAFTTCNTDATRGFVPFAPGRHHFRLQFDAGYFTPGRYVLKIAAHLPQRKLLDLIDDELSFTVHDSGSHASALRDSRVGVLCPLIPWQHTTQ